MKIILIPMLLISTLLIGCASSPDKLQSTYVSPMLYKNFSCSQIAEELQRVSRRASELHGVLDEIASTDRAQVAVSLIFWPALFFVEGGDGVQAAEYSRLKGERDALEQMSIKKKCGINIIETK